MEMMFKLKERIKSTHDRFLKIHDEPREVALGLALGLFVAMSPTMGFQMIIAVFFATLLKWNKITAAIAVWLTNPVTAPFIYSVTYLIGAKLLGTTTLRALPKELSFSTIVALLQKAPEIILSMGIGGVIVGLPLSIIGYYFSYSAIHKYQKDIKGKRKKQKEKKRKLKEEKRIHQQDHAKSQCDYSTKN